MKKKEAYYFSHDGNAQDDHKCMQLIDQMGMEGYGIFWALIEKLRSEKNYQLPLESISSFAKRWGTNPEKIEKVIKDFKLFKIKQNYFFSHRLKNSMEEKTKNSLRSLSKRWPNSDALRPYSNGIANGLQNGTIKVNENKKRKKGDFPPSGGPGLRE